jgi:hypothetical protein
MFKSSIKSLGNVIAMRPKMDGASLAPVRHLEAYWTSLRDGGAVPLRTQIDPRGILDILPFAFLIERLSPSVSCIRLGGQRMAETMGTEPCGLPFGLMFKPDMRSAIATCINAVLDTPAIANLDLTGSQVMGRPIGSARLSLLPIRNPRGGIDRAIGVFVPDAENLGVRQSWAVNNIDMKAVFGPSPSMARTSNTIHSDRDTNQSPHAQQQPRGASQKSAHLQLVKF